MDECEKMEVEDMIEIENIKQELQIKEELDLSCVEQLDYLSNDEFSNKDIPETQDSWNEDNQLQNNDQEQSILKQNPFSNIKISNICFTSNSKEIFSISQLPEPDGLFENEIDRIIFQCETCNGVIRDHINADHTYAIKHNRLRQVVEKEEKKDSSDQFYKCSFCTQSLESPQKYLLHLQTHELEITRCRSCNEQLKLSDSLNAHIIIKFRSCKICRKLFTHVKGYRQHLHSHYLDKDVITMGPETCLKDEEGPGKEENNENETVVAEDTETFLKHKKTSETEKDVEKTEEERVTCNTLFSESVKTTKDFDSEIIVLEKGEVKEDCLKKTKEITVNNERNEVFDSTSSNKLNQENQKEEAQEEKSQSNFSQTPISIDDSMKDVTALTESEKVIYLFECRGCSRNFVSRKAILEHVTGKHVEEYRMWDSLYKVKKLVDKKPTLTTDGKYICRFCPVKFDTVSVYMTHLNEHHLCIHCDKIFQNKEILEDHKHQLQESLICRICNMSFVLKSNFLTHLKSHDNECASCQEQFTSESMLLVHKKVFHPEGICYICHKWFSSKEILNKHKLRMHNVSLQSFSCWLCGRKYKLEAAFRSHMGTHGEKRPFSCPHCGKFYARYGPMAAHSEKCDFFDVRKIFECTVCKIAFYDGKKYVSHMKEHLENYKIQPMNTDYLKELESLKDDEDLKKTNDSKNKTNSKTLSNQKNLKILPITPKIVWRESSFPKMHGNKLDKERQRKRQKKESDEKMKSFVKKCPASRKKSVPVSKKKSADMPPTNKVEMDKIQCEIISDIKKLPEETEQKVEMSKIITFNQSILKSNKCTELIGQKQEFIKNLPNLPEGMKYQSFQFHPSKKDPLINKDTLQNLLLVVRKRPEGIISQENSVEKVLLLKPISQSIIKKKGKKNIKTPELSTYSGSNSQNELIDITTLENQKETVNEIITLPDENEESDPLALENSPMDSENQIETSSPASFESDPLALENSPIDSTSKMDSVTQMKNSSVICEFDQQAFVNGNLDMDSEEKVNSPTRKKLSSKTKNEILKSPASRMLLMSQETNVSDERDEFVRNTRSKIHANSSKEEIDEKEEPKKKKSKSKDAKPVKNAKNNEDFFFCTICKERISLKAWVQHMKIHEVGLKMFKCSTCDKKFNTYVGQIRHEKTHSKE